MTEENKTCNKETEVFSRITGYHRPIKQWHKGKLQEFKDRKTFKFKVSFNANNEVTIDKLPPSEVTHGDKKYNE